MSAVAMFSFLLLVQYNLSAGAQIKCAPTYHASKTKYKAAAIYSPDTLASFMFMCARQFDLMLCMLCQVFLV